MIDNKTLDVKISASVAKLTELFGNAPEVAVVLGSGWAGAVSLVEEAKHLPYTELPAFPQPKVEGHVNEIVVGTHRRRSASSCCVAAPTPMRAATAPAWPARCAH